MTTTTTTSALVPDYLDVTTGAEHPRVVPQLRGRRRDPAVADPFSAVGALSD